MQSFCNFPVLLKTHSDENCIFCVLSCSGGSCFHDGGITQRKLNFLLANHCKSGTDIKKQLKKACIWEVEATSGGPQAPRTTPFHCILADKWIHIGVYFSCLS